MKKLVDGKLEDMTAEEISEMEEQSIKSEEEKTAILNYINKSKDLKASAKAKLMAGEPMTEEEANLTLHIL